MAGSIDGLFRNRTPLKGRFPKERGPLAQTDLLQFYRGDTIRIDLQIFDETGTPQDVTGATIKSTWKDDDCFVQAIFELTEGSGITVLDATQGIVRVELTPDQSANFIPASYVFDVEVTLSDSTVGTVVKRWVEILPDVTEVFPPPTL